MTPHIAIPSAPPNALSIYFADDLPVVVSAVPYVLPDGGPSIEHYTQIGYVHLGTYGISPSAFASLIVLICRQISVMCKIFCNARFD